MPAYDYLRKKARPIGCARAPTYIEFEEGRCVVLERDVVEGGEEARDGARACPTCL